MKLIDSRCRLAEHKRNVWAVMPEMGVPFDRVKEPDYWTHVASRLQPGDQIEVTAEDFSYFARLIVISSGRSWAQVKVLEAVNLMAQEAKVGVAPGTGFTVKWRGARKFSVVRDSDGVIMREDIATREEADRWINDHVKALAA